MKFSYFLPNMLEGRFAKMGSVAWRPMLERVRTAEDLGYDGLWLGEYIETQKDVATGFPGEPPNNYAPLTTMTALAMSSEKLRVTTGVIVLPYYDPLILGREMATLDNITNGRITLGIGLGGEAEDYRRTRQQLGKVNRSRMMEECTEAMRALWTEPMASFHGDYYSFDDLQTYPKPVQNPFPIYMAGRVDAVFRRIAKYAQGWIEVGFNPENMKSRAELIRQYMEEEGRGEEHLEVARQFFMSIGETEREAEENKSSAIAYKAKSVARKGIAKASSGDEFERVILGSVEYVRERMHAYAAAGVTEMCVTFYESDTKSALRQLELFATRIMPDFK